jgi:hypothetical protein
MSDDDDRAELVNATIAEARATLARCQGLDAPAPRSFAEPANLAHAHSSEPEPLRRAYGSKDFGEEPEPAERSGGMRYRTGRGAATARPEARSEGINNADTLGAPAVADADPYEGWNEWLAAGIAAAIAEERKLQRAVQAEIVAHLQRQFDDALKDVRGELEAEIALRAAEVGRELALRAAELELAVLAAKTDITDRMTKTISEMRRVLAAGDARAAENGPNKVLN